MERTTFQVRYILPLPPLPNSSGPASRIASQANQHALFQDLVNVGLGANYQIVSGQTGAPVSCINCGSNLGSKFVTLSIETSAIKAGRFMIDMTKLFFWNGNQMLRADTEQPVLDV